MSIIDSFDAGAEGLISPNQAYKKSETTLSACIINFSYKIMDALVEDSLIELIDPMAIRSISENYAMYRFIGTDIGIIRTSVGAPITSTIIEESSYIFSCKKFILFGSCGGLDKSIPPSKIIVPTHAYRDEGLSYHYAPAKDYIEIKNHEAVSEILGQIGVDFVLGKTWTTDAFYRETRRNMELRKSEGCIAVEMEISACQAVCDFRGYDFYPFLYRADNLDSANWDPSILSILDIDERLKHLAIALELAKRVI